MMDPQEDSSRFGSIPTTTSRNISSSSSTFFSANQSPFFSPPKLSTATIADALDRTDENIGFVGPEINIRSVMSDISATTPAGASNENIFSRERQGRSRGTPITAISSNRLRSCDVFIGLYGRKPALLRFSSWLRAELEIQGMSCFVSDRSRCRNSRKRVTVERAMDVSTFGVVILTRKSFRNPYTIEELRYFSSKKNLVPIYFDLSPGDCLVRDVVEKRGELWEKHGGELWALYGGIEKEWREAVNGLSRVDEWQLEAQGGNWRDCILKTVTLVAMRLGRRSVVDRLSKWRDRVEKNEFPMPRNESFVGRKKELTELEFMLSGEQEGDYLELKARSRRKSVTIGWNESRRKEQPNLEGKGKEVWKESEKEIEMTDFSRPRIVKYARRRRSTKVVYGKGIACVSGESGIGKTELLLEFAYQNHQRYKMVLWIGGESRYIRQNYLNLWSFLDVDVGIDNSNLNSTEKSRFKSFEEQEEAAVSRIRRELMRNIPFLVVIDNLETEKDWWDHKLVMDLLPRFGGDTHIIISTQLPRVMNIEPLKLSYLSAVEAMQLMQGSTITDYSLTEIDALRAIEDKLSRSTLGLAIVGSVLSELPINPTRLLDTINRMPLRDMTWSDREFPSLRRNMFLLQLFEVCFSIFDHADGGPRSLATRMVEASGWFAPSAVPIALLTSAAQKIPEKHHRTRFLRKLLCDCASSHRSAADAVAILIRFNMARSSTNQDRVLFNDLVKNYARKRAGPRGSEVMVHGVLTRGSPVHSDHLWAASFLLLGFSTDPISVELKASELLHFVKEVALPLAKRTFITFSRCAAALELLRRCTDALEAADHALVTPIDKWFDKSLCWRPIHTTAQLNPSLWQDLALLRATVLETRAKLMLRGGLFDIADDLIRKAIYIRTSISGEDHSTTVAARETLSRVNRLLANVQIHSSP